MIASDNNVVDLLAQSLCAAWHSDAPVYADQANGTAWDALSSRQKGNWRRAARVAMIAISGNQHWLTDPWAANERD